MDGAFVEVRSKETGKLLFKLDTDRALLEIVERGRAELVDLTQYNLQPVAPSEQATSKQEAGRK